MKMFKQWKKRWAGFSLVEIVIAIAVIGIMSAASVPLIKSTLDKSKNSRAKSELEEIRNASVSFYGDTFQVPGNIGCTKTATTHLLTDTAAAKIDMSKAGTVTSDDLDAHFNTNCTGANAGKYTDNSLGGAWRGPYMEADRYDPWQKSYVLVTNTFGTTDTASGYALSGGTDEQVNTAKATAASTSDVYIKVSLK
ncbi:MAG: prepilin-type N-terminal cleavage/methylation domain-containing protein [SAR324 cluster bacterium]|nr:prepilin-type N-terminal cleavage/methylation domain-containing protein [SAR324 cluster bacterium]